jgi:aminoglycoside 2'-N-acetyltransferase I
VQTVTSRKISTHVEIREGGEDWWLAEPLLEAVWPTKELGTIAWGDLVFAEADKRVLVWVEDGPLICHIGLFIREMRWNDCKVTAGGIGGVATLPDFRGCGIAGLALHHAALDFTVAQLDFGLLFCEAHNFAFYQKRGWQQFEGTVFMEQPSGRTRLTSMTPFVLDIRLSPRSGSFDLGGLPW